jgi:threonine dehydrogenase-like Zn-dependent dehydrogenase
MKAAQFSQFGGPEVLEIVDLPDPHPGPGQVRIAVRAAGISGTDWKLRKGALTFGAGLPQTTGRDVAGVVDEIGEGVTDVAAGDRVFGVSDSGTAGTASGSPLRCGQAWIDTGLRYCLTAVCAGSAGVRAALCAGVTHFGAPEGQCGVVAPFLVPALGPMATGRRSILLHACGRSATGTATPAG